MTPTIDCKTPGRNEHLLRIAILEVEIQVFEKTWGTPPSFVSGALTFPK